MPSSPSTPCRVSCSQVSSRVRPVRMTGVIRSTTMRRGTAVTGWGAAAPVRGKLTGGSLPGDLNPIGRPGRIEDHVHVHAPDCSLSEARHVMEDRASAAAKASAPARRTPQWSSTVSDVVCRPDSEAQGLETRHRGRTCSKGEGSRCVPEGFPPGDTDRSLEAKDARRRVEVVDVPMALRAHDEGAMVARPGGSCPLECVLRTGTRPRRRADPR